MHFSGESKVAIPIIFFLLCYQREFFVSSSGLQREFQDAIDPVPLYGHQIPVLKMMKRQLRNFRGGETASISLIFRVTRAFQVRWFVEDPARSSASSEIPNMLPVEGNPLFNVSLTSSGDVTATTIAVPEFPALFPARFECIISTKDGTFQYQIRTIVRQETDFQLDNVDGPEWMVVPPPTWSYILGGFLKLQCKVFVPLEQNAYTNELVLFKTNPSIRESSLAKIEFERVISIHQDTLNYAEEHGTTILQGMRKELKRGHAFYEVRMSTSNSTPYFEGIYQCAIERQFDKMVTLSYASIRGNDLPFPAFPTVHLVFCGSGANAVYTSVLVIREGQTACVRCRGIAFPRPKVAIYKGDLEVLSDENISVNHYINVADAGVNESVYVIRRPSAAMSGRYECRAANDISNKMIPFTIAFRKKTS